MHQKNFIKVFEYGTGEKKLLGYVRAEVDCSYSAIRQEIVQDSIVNEPFDFVIEDEDNDRLCTLNATQEERWQVENKKCVGIKRLLSMVDERGPFKRVCRSLNDTMEAIGKEGDQRLQNVDGGKVHGSNMLKSFLVSKLTLDNWEVQCEKTCKKLRERNPAKR